MSKNPDHKLRRTVIRDWMALPRAERETPGQAAAFIGKAGTRYVFQAPGDPAARMLSWLTPRIGRA